MSYLKIVLPKASTLRIICLTLSLLGLTATAGTKLIGKALGGLSLRNSNAAQQPTHILRALSTTFQRSQSNELKIELESPPTGDISTLVFTLRFDPNVLRLTPPLTSAIIKGSGISVDPSYIPSTESEGFVNIFFGLLPPNTIPGGKIELAKIKFTPVAGSTVPNTQVRLTDIVASGVDPNVPISFAPPENATVTFSQQCPTITVNPPAVNTGTVGVSFNQSFTQTGGITPVTFTLNSGTLPQGLTLNSNGTLSGTPTKNGSFPITVKATDANSCMGVSGTYTLTINCPTITLNATGLSGATVGNAFNAMFTASGGTPPYTFNLSAGMLPPGLSLAPSGSLTGTPTQSGSFNFNIKATDANGCTGMQPFTITISSNNQPPTINPVSVSRQQGSPPSNSTIANVSDANQAANTLAVTVNGSASVTVNGVTVSGISISAVGVVTASVAAACNGTTANFNLRVTDSGGLFAEATLTVTVTQNSPPTLGYAPQQTVVAGNSLTVSPNAGPSDNGSVTSIVLQSITPTFGGTVTVNNLGVVTISDAKPPGSYTVTIRATDNCGTTTNGIFTLNVTPGNTPPTISPAPVSRQQGSPAANSTIANVGDAEQAPNTLTVVVNDGASATVNGVTVSGLSINAAGVVTANIVAACSATTANFTLTVKDSANASKQATLIVTVSPNTPPVLGYSNRTVSVGNSLTLNPATGPGDNGNVTGIAVQSIAPNTFSGNISVNNSTGVVSVSNANPVGSYTVTIRATDNCGKTTDVSFTLVVEPVCSPPSITSQPSNQTVCTGASATFTVTAVGTNLNYQWRRNGTAVQGATDVKLTLNNVTAANAGSYDVVVTGTCGTVTSTAALLTVSVGLNVTAQPTNQVVVAGNNATFTAAANGIPTPSVQWQVSTNSGAAFSNINGATGTTLTVPGVTAAQNGNLYRAVFTNNCNTVTTTAALLTVSIPTNTGSNVTVSIGQQTITFANVTSPGVTTVKPIPVTSAPPLPSGFTLDGLNQAYDISTTAGFSGKIRLCFTVPQVNEQTVFQMLRVLHGEGNPLMLVDRTVLPSDFATHTVCAEVTSLSPFVIATSSVAIVTQPASLIVCAGAPATFSVVATGANLSYQWRKNGVSIQGATGSSFTIASTTANDAGSYDVIVTSGASSITSNVATLTVRPTTAITTQPADQTVCAGASATFTVAASGATVNFQWRRNGVAIQGATGATLTLNNVTAANTGSYDVVVTGACGAVTSAARALTVNAAPSITTHPTNQTAIVGGSATFTAAASGTPAPTVQWQVSTDNGANFTNINGATGITLTVSALVVGDNGKRYRAVFTNSCGTVNSNAAVLTIPDNPKPGLTSLNPNPVVAGGAAFTLAINGSKFISGSTVRWNGANRATTFVSSTQLTTPVTAVDIANPGTVRITVFNPAPGGGISNELTLTIFPPLANVSAASYLGTELAAEMIVAAFGTGLAPQVATAQGLPLPTSLAGTSVKVRDNVGTERLAPLFFVSSGQINYLVPTGTVTGLATITVMSGADPISFGQVRIANVAPGFFTANANGLGVFAGVALRVKSNGAQSFEAISRFDSTRGFVPIPINLGASNEQVFLILFGTGWRFRSALSAPTAQIGGTNVEVLYIGAQGSMIGLDQLNLRLPRSLAGRGEVNITLSVDGKTANIVKVSIL